MHSKLAWFVRKAVPRKVLMEAIARQNAQITAMQNALHAQQRTITEASALIAVLRSENMAQAEALARVRSTIIPATNGPQRRH